MHQDVLDGGDEAQACPGGLAVYAEDAAFSIEMMEEGCELVGVFRDALGCSFFRGAVDELVVVFHLFDEIELTLFGELGEVCAFEGAIPCHAGFFGLVEEAVDAGVGVLDVVHRVVAGLFLCQVDVEVHLGVQGAGAEEISGCVGADFFHQFAEGDGLAGTLGHFHLFAVPEEGDHLEEHDFEIVGVVAQEFHGGLQTDDVAVVVSAPDVDEFVVAAANFISYIGDVGAEIGGHAIGTDDHAVFVVAVLGGAEPQGAVLFVHVVFVFEDFQRCVHFGGVQGFLREPVVEVHVEIVEVFLEIRQFFLEAPFFENLEALFLVHVQVFLPVFGKDFLGGLDDVLALVAALRDFCVQAAELQVAGVDGFGQVVDLISRIVDVVFRPHVVAGSAEQVDHRRAEGCATSVADVEKAGGVGGNVLHQDAVFFIFRQVAVGGAYLQDIFQFAVHGVRGQVEIDEAGAGDFRLGNQRGVDVLHDGFCDHAGRFVCYLRPLHGCIGGVITEFFGFRYFQALHRGIVAFRQFAGGNGCVFRLCNDFFQFVSDFHECSESSRSSIIISFK